MSKAQIWTIPICELQNRFCVPYTPLAPPMSYRLNLLLIVFAPLRFIPSPSRLWGLLEVHAGQLQCTFAVVVPILGAPTSEVF